VLNKVATLEQRRRGPRCLVRALGWGPWDGGMVDVGVRARFASMGVPLIPLAEGARLMRDELCAAGDAEVVIGGAVSGHRPAEPGALKIEAEMVVDRAHWAFLDGHRVRGAVVVPVALVLEWFARAARACRPDLTLAACREVQVLRGIRLSHFDDGAAERFVLRARQLSNGHEATIAVELLGADGSRHYSAICEMKERSPLPDRTLAEPAELAPWSGTIYDGEVLFHGPAFQVIRSVDGIAGGGLTATLEGVTARGWLGSWQLDPALLDGGLQAAVLWAQRKLGAASLPTAISSLHIYHPGPAVGPIRCVLAGRESRTSGPCPTPRSWPATAAWWPSCAASRCTRCRATSIPRVRPRRPLPDGGPERLARALMSFAPIAIVGRAASCPERCRPTSFGNWWCRREW